MKVWHCNECGKESTTDDHIVAHFHLCPVGHKTGSVRPLARDEERVAWARQLLGADLVEAFDREDEL